MSPAASCLAAALVHFLWQGVAIALSLRMAQRGTSDARARHGLAVLALLAMLAAPVVTFAALWAGTWLHATGSPLASSFAHPGSLAGGAAWRGASRVAPAKVILVAWAVGVAVMGARLAGGLLHLRRIVRGAEVLAAPWPARLAAIAARLGVERAVRLAASAKISAPVVIGWFRPVVLLPVAFLADLSPVDLEALLAHELAHVRRADWIANLAQALVEGLLFYHPCVFWVSRQLSEAREECCDDDALWVVGHPLVLARALAAAESARAVALALSSNGGSLMERIRRLVASPPARQARWAAPALVLLSLLVIGATPLLARASAPDRVPAGAALAEDPSALPIPWLPAAVQRWAPQITLAASRNGVDPELLAIVTLMESGGDPDAVSPMGAIGLVQVMPATAEKIAAERGMEGAVALRDPATNLDLGAYFLAAQLRAFGSVELAAAAYNGGPDAVRSWLAGTGALSEETAHYKGRVAQLWAQRRAATKPAKDERP